MPFQIIRNDITKMQVDAIVNPANPMPGYAAGIDSAVYKAAGEEKLLRRRQEIGAIVPGSSFITDGYNLPAKYIIYTVGTAWQGGTSDEETILRKCYRSIFRLALEHHILSLAIPLLASGSYGFPKGIALRIALSEIESFLSENDIELYLVVFDEKSYSLSTELYGDIDEYINKHYVEKRFRKSIRIHMLEEKVLILNPLEKTLFTAYLSAPDFLNQIDERHMIRKMRHRMINRITEEKSVYLPISVRKSAWFPKFEAWRMR